MVLAVGPFLIGIILMDYLIYITYILLIVLIAWNAKYNRDGFNEEYNSLAQSKSIQGLFAILIMVHHISQKLCEPGTVPAKYVKHGLDPFMYIGYLLVAYYFFSSGYGLYKSVKNKENYFNGFLSKHLTPVIVVLALSSYAFMYVGTNNGLREGFSSPMSLFGPNTNNPYSWYIYAIILCYILFYNAFKRAKTDKAAIIIINVGLVLYMIFCNYWLYGDWWYNTVLLFPLGSVYALNEEKITSAIYGNYRKYLITSISVLIIGFMVTQWLSAFTYRTNLLFGYQAGQMLLAVLRNVTSLSFVLMVLMITMKVRLGNKIIDAVGACTLEFYLIHGLFVQIFSYEFISGTGIKLYYIKNPLLYVLVVFLCSIATAYYGKIVVDWVVNWFHKSQYARVFCIDMSKLLLAALIIVILVTIKTKYEDVKITEERSEVFKEFCSGQDYVETSYGKMSYYMQGEGNHTIVLLGLNIDPSSQLVHRYITKYLSKGNRVVIIDTLGKGFSDDATTPRTAENVALELHEAIHTLNVDDKYIFMPCEYNGTYVMKYLEKYPEDVEAIIGVDMMLPTVYEAVVADSGVNSAIYKAAVIKDCRHSLNRQKIFKALGYSRWYFKVYESLWSNYSLKEYLPMIEEIFVRRVNLDTAVEERLLWGSNCDSIQMDTFPENVPTLMIIDYVLSRANIGNRWVRDRYDSYISNPDLQYSIILSGDPYFMYYKGDMVSKQVNAFIRDCVDGDGLHKAEE